MTDDFDTAVARIHRRRFAYFVLGQLIGLALLVGMVALIYIATRSA